MTVKSFLIDRLFYITAYVLNIALMLLVVQLGLFENNAPLSMGNVLYLVLLSVAVLILLLLIDYVRQHRFYKSVNRFLHSDSTRDDISLLQGARTQEQHVLRQLIERQYRLYTEELSTLRKRHKQHIHFVNQWVHQMKSPVSVINLVLQRGRGKYPNDNLNASIMSIEEETEKLAHGLEMMLYTARLDAFALDVKAERVDLLPVLRETVNAHKKACIHYAVFPKIQAKVEKVIVQTDAKWMRFVFNQLITNAIKYSRSQPGSKTLWINVSEDEEGWCVAIKDEGVGIPQHDLPRVFDAFFTGENGRTFPESTGMGLFLVKQVCDRLEHRLHIQSEEQEGTTVTITFPHQRHLYDL